MVCRQLQCGAAILGNVSITATVEDVLNGSIEVVCTEPVPTRAECRMNQTNGSDCADVQIVQVTCSGPFRVRLADGNNMCSGRVELSYQSTWEAVCGAGWDRQNGDVVCRELGCGEAVTVNITDPQAGTRKVLLRGVACQGTETTLYRCPSDPIDTNSSAHCVPASVRCSGPVPLRLVNGTNACSGRVEVYHHGVWGTVCDNGWDRQAAGVVCQLLNCGSALSVAGGGQYGAGAGVIWLDELSCNGAEVALDQCSTKPWGVNNCNHSQDAGVSCSGPVRVRLENGHTVCSGRVEVYHLGSWGTVCDAGWDIREAGVVCQMLNCGPALSAHTGSYFGGGTGEIWLEGVRCLGTETALDQCTSGTPVTNRCTHNTDAGVTCS
ncbi:CD5 antigen-like, partial [Mustelus asterias]